MRRICIFCGSNSGSNPAYLEAARTLGRGLAEAKVGVVYGGASVGLMGALADAALAAGGEVVGIIPKVLVDKEIAHRGLEDLRVVASMHERKALMAEISDGFAALPGGVGTLEELFEVWTWAQLGHHAKPCALLNVAGFYDPLIAFLDSVAGQGFMKQVHRAMLIVAHQPERLLGLMRSYEAPVQSKWITSAER